MVQSELILVTGATGYIGGRLVPRLLQAGYRVRCLVRSAERLRGRPWTDRVDIVEGDALQSETLVPALQGVSAAFYLIHSLCQANARYATRPHGGRTARASIGRLQAPEIAV